MRVRGASSTSKNTIPSLSAGPVTPISGLIGGAIAFCAPEQLTQFREAQPASDQYSAGATRYKLLTGRNIYDLPAALNRQILMVLQENPAPLAVRRHDVPAELAAVVDRSLERNPQARFPDAAAFRQALLPFAG